MVDFSIFLHLNHGNMSNNSMANAEKRVTGMSLLTYAIDDDQTVITVTTGEAEVISEYYGKRFTP